MARSRSLEELRRSGERVTIRDLMDAALYDPAEGYYGSGRARFGARGDFSTSSTIHPVFGEVVAAWIVERWEALGRPGAFSIVEVGPGDGSLAASILESIRTAGPAEFAPEYVLVERSRALAARQRETLDSERGRVSWTGLERLATEPVTGVLISNELVDALPVHRARIVDGRIEEQFAVCDGRRWTLAWDAPSSAAIAPYVARFAANWLEIGSSPEIEIGLDAVAWMGAAASCLDRGAILTIDYGDVADRLYTSERPGGTLRAFRDHSLAPDPLDHLGRLDLTASVNFSALMAAGRDHGLETVSFEPQRAFLDRYGLIDRVARRAPSASLAERLAMKTLVAPGGLGDRIQVLVQSK